MLEAGVQAKRGAMIPIFVEHGREPTPPEVVMLARPAIIPKGWRETRCGPGWTYRHGALALVVISEAKEEADGKVWLHVSVSRKDRIPSWEDLVSIKNIFIGKDEKAVQVLPPTKEHVDINPNVLHLYRCLDGDPLPDFRVGGIL